MPPFFSPTKKLFGKFQSILLKLPWKLTMKTTFPIQIKLRIKQSFDLHYWNTTWNKFALSGEQAKSTMSAAVWCFNWTAIALLTRISANGNLLKTSFGIYKRFSRFQPDRGRRKNSNQFCQLLKFMQLRFIATFSIKSSFAIKIYWQLEEKFLHSFHYHLRNWDCGCCEN